MLTHLQQSAFFVSRRRVSLRARCDDVADCSGPFELLNFSSLDRPLRHTDDGESSVYGKLMFFSFDLSFPLSNVFCSIACSPRSFWVFYDLLISSQLAFIS